MKRVPLLLEREVGAPLTENKKSRYFFFYHYNHSFESRYLKNK